MISCSEEAEPSTAGLPEQLHDAAARSVIAHLAKLRDEGRRSGAQLEALRATVAAVAADVVVVATPCDLPALIAIEQPVVRVRYEFEEAGEPGLGSLVEDFLLRRDLLRG